MRRIKALLDFVRTTPANLLVRANAVYAGLNGNPAYTRLPVDLSEFRAEIDGYAAAIAEALDGSKRAFAERKRRGEVVVHMLLKFAHYVEIECNGDLPTFLSSGFQPASTSRTQNGPRLGHYPRRSARLFPAITADNCWLRLSRRQRRTAMNCAGPLPVLKRRRMRGRPSPLRQRAQLPWLRT